MICKRIRYRNFRNIEEAEICPSDSVTVLNGKNGQGKTNALEGIYAFAGGRSFRTVHENELVRFGSEFAELEMTYSDGKRDHVILLRWVPGIGKRFCKKNGVPITKLSELMGSFRSVLFCPEHLSIVQEGPAVRRRFLDNAISQTDVTYLRALQKYNSVLAQRNAAIRLSRERRDDSIFLSVNEMWAEQMSDEAELISERRASYVEKLSLHVDSVITDMTEGRESASVTYLTRKNRNDYYRELTEAPEKELRAGMTLHGVQKDDMHIGHCGREARAFSSQGQQRSIALAMKIAEGEIAKEITGDYPVFLFDDILSELDEGRRKFLLSGVAGRQVIITSCDKIDTEAKIYRVEQGKISEVLPF